MSCFPNLINFLEERRIKKFKDIIGKKVSYFYDYDFGRHFVNRIFFEDGTFIEFFSDSEGGLIIEDVTSDDDIKLSRLIERLKLKGFEELWEEI